jgi:hypothetical protein
MKLSRQGYGDINTIKNLDVETFINLVNYENYLDKYAKVFRDLNRKN